MTIQPGDIIPSQRIYLTNGETLSLPDGLQSDHLTLLVVYRGLHCGICKTYITELSQQVDALTALGVDVVVASSDPVEKAQKAQAEWAQNRMQFGYGLTEEDGKQLRLFLTAKRKDTEPDRFFEPGMYLLGDDGKVLFVSVQSMPFGRPGIAEMVSRIGWMLENSIPPRGTVRY